MATKPRRAKRGHTSYPPPPPSQPSPKPMPLMFEYVPDAGPDLPPEIETVLNSLRRLFSIKNTEYRSESNPFANFYDAAPVAQGKLSPVEYCLTLCSKQDDALWKAIIRGEVNTTNLRERILDGAVYRIIALALLELNRP